MPRSSRPPIAFLILVSLCVVVSVVFSMTMLTCRRAPVTPAHEPRGKGARPAPSPQAPQPGTADQPQTRGGGRPGVREGVPPPVPPAHTEVVKPAARPAPARTTRLHVIIDDAGYSLEQLEAFLRFPGALTIAVLPQLPYSEASARRVLEAGKELILHQPMEAESGVDPGPGALMLGMSGEEVRSVLAKNLETVPGALGMNNHMGSAATADADLMREVALFLKEHSLYFVDSRTTADSQAASAARRSGVPTTERHVFLDNEESKKAITEALHRGMNGAVRRGYAVMIGHVWSAELAEVLLEMYPQMLDAGFEFAPVSELLAEKDGHEGSWD